MTQPTVAYRSVKALDVSILLRVSWLDITQGYSLLLRPTFKLFAGLFLTIVTADNGGFVPPYDNLLQRPFDP